jgi:hypothetical protein
VPSFEKLNNPSRQLGLINNQMSKINNFQFDRHIADLDDAEKLSSMHP